MRRSALIFLAFLTLVVPVGLTARAEAVGTGSISGAVTDSAGSPLTGVTVTVVSLSDSSQSQTTSGSDGSFTVGGLAAGNYYVCFQAASATGGASSLGYVDTCWRDIDASGGVVVADTTQVTVTEGANTSGIMQKLPSAGGVSGVVTDSSGNPLAGAVVYADSQSSSLTVNQNDHATTDATGHYAIPRLRPSGDYTVCVSADNVTGGSSSTGYLDQCYGHVGAQFGDIPFGTAQTFAVNAAASTVLDPIKLDAAAQIAGTITDHDGNPIPGIQVYGWQTNGPVTATGTTDSAGNFLLSVDNPNGSANGEFHGTRIPTASYTIFFSAPTSSDFVSGSYSGVPSAYGTGLGSPTTVTPAGGSTTTITDHLQNAGSISGVVTDDHGHPLNGAQVTISYGSQYLTQVATDSAGAYQVGKLPAGNYSVCFSGYSVIGGTAPAGYLGACSGGSASNKPQTVVLAENQDLTGVDGVLPWASGISGRVSDPTSHGISDARVDLYKGGVIQGDTYTGSDGTYTFGSLLSGTYTVCFNVSYPSVWSGCYNNARDSSTGTPVTIGAGQLATGIDGAFLPDVTPPTVSLLQPAALFTTQRVIRPVVSAADSQSGFNNYDVRYRYADWHARRFSAYTYPSSWQQVVGPLTAITGVPGRTYCFSARARDGVGNTSAFTHEKCTTMPLDDRSLARTSGTWTRSTSRLAYSGTVTSTRTYGATLTLRGAWVSQVAVLVTTCATCGRVAVYSNGHLLGTFSTYSRTTRHRVLLVPRGFKYHDATISLKLVQHSRELIIDGLAVTRW